MAKQKKIGLIYNYSEQWIGGTYYILNIIKSLNYLPANQKPQLLIFYNQADKLELIKETNYPYLTFHALELKNKFLKKIIYYIKRLTKVNITAIYNKFLVDSVFLTWHNDNFKYVKNKVTWVPDFQEFHLPQYFSEQQIKDRSSFPDFISKQENYKLVLSSHDAQNDFKHFFPAYKCKTQVVQFASILPEFNSLDINKLFRKFDIKTPYFICSNQLWQHKNHITVLKAVNHYIKNINKNILVLFTGKDADFRTKDYFQNLKEYISDNNLQSNIKFLGFIKREEQLQLMKNSLSIIQPSLFEGWSTTVEDAKAINKYILLSAIPVHLEQMKKNVSFFEPTDYYKLSELLNQAITNGVTEVEIDYNKHITQFAENFVNALTN